MFESGLEFLRADFHLHTQKDKEFMSMGWGYYMISWQIPNAGGTIESTITLTSGDFSVEIPVKITRK